MVGQKVTQVVDESLEGILKATYVKQSTNLILLMKNCTAQLKSGNVKHTRSYLEGKLKNASDLKQRIVEQTAYWKVKKEYLLDNYIFKKMTFKEYQVKHQEFYTNYKILLKFEARFEKCYFEFLKSFDKYFNH